MIHLFEDKAGVELSELLKMSIARDIEVGFVGGHDKFLPYIEGRGIENKYVAYVDIAIDNSSTVEAYNRLVQAKKDGIAEVIPVPIVNAEYDYLKLCREFGLDIDHELCNLAIEVNPEYKEIAERKTGAKFKNFEKYCKWLTKCNLQSCATLRQHGCKMIRQKCLCEWPGIACYTEASAEEKARKFVSGRTVKPRGVGECTECGLGTSEVTGKIVEITQLMNGRLATDVKLKAIEPKLYENWD